jgi:hypothetical protein
MLVVYNNGVVITIRKFNVHKIKLYLHTEDQLCPFKLLREFNTDCVRDSGITLANTIFTFMIRGKVSK